MRTIFMLLFVGLTISGIGTDGKDKLKWKKLKTEDSVRETILKYLPLQSSRKEFILFIERQNKVQYSDLNEKVVYVSAKAKSTSPIIERKWLMEFIFDEKDLLIDLKVKEGLTGP